MGGSVNGLMTPSGWKGRGDGDVRWLGWGDGVPYGTTLPAIELIKGSVRMLEV